VLRFLFAAMAPKAAEDVPFQGIPAMLYLEYVPRNIFHVGEAGDGVQATGVSTDHVHGFGRFNLQHLR
jgi:hypothetical protein